MPDFGWVLRCGICRNSVNLAVSKTDEFGRAVHENCLRLEASIREPNYCNHVTHPECQPPTPVQLQLAGHI